MKLLPKSVLGLLYLVLSSHTFETIAESLDKTANTNLRSGSWGYDRAQRRHDGDITVDSSSEGREAVDRHGGWDKTKQARHGVEAPFLGGTLDNGSVKSTVQAKYGPRQRVGHRLLGANDVATTVTMTEINVEVRATENVTVTTPPEFEEGAEAALDDDDISNQDGHDPLPSDPIRSSVSNETPEMEVGTEEATDDDDLSNKEVHESLRNGTVLWPATKPTLDTNNVSTEESSLAMNETSPEEENEKCTFYAIGDTPYSPLEECLLPYELSRLTNTGGDFLIHLGDIKDGRFDKDCSDDKFNGLKDIFKVTPVQAFFVVGDNEWVDCLGDPSTAFSNWAEYFVEFERYQDSTLFGPEIDVERDSERREIFAFFQKKILFAGFSLPGNPDPRVDGWDDIVDIQAKFLVDQFEKYQSQMKAAVIFGHSLHRDHSEWTDTLESVARDYPDIPILFLQDGHNFVIQEELFNEPNLLTIALDDTVTPTKITVDPLADALWEVFQLDRGCPCTTDHKDTQLVEYSRGSCVDRCAYVENCKDESPASNIFPPITEIPSSAPSSAPSSLPSGLPTVFISDTPTLDPPSTSPSVLPSTEVLSSYPSLSPSALPTGMPSTGPQTDSHTSAPSVHPTGNINLTDNETSLSDRPWPSEEKSLPTATAGGGTLRPTTEDLDIATYSSTINVSANSPEEQGLTNSTRHHLPLVTDNRADSSTIASGNTTRPSIVGGPAVGIAVNETAATHEKKGSSSEEGGTLLSVLACWVFGCGQ